MIDMMAGMPWFLAGLFLSAGLAAWLDRKHVMPVIATRVRVERRVSLVELLDAMAKAQLVDAGKALVTNGWMYEDDIGDKLDPETAASLKRMTGGNDGE